MHTTRGMPLMWSTACNGNATCVEIAALPDGGAAIRDSKDAEGPVLRFGAEEWAAFLNAVKAGRFDHPMPGVPARPSTTAD